MRWAENTLTHSKFRFICKWLVITCYKFEIWVLIHLKRKCSYRTVYKKIEIENSKMSWKFSKVTITYDPLNRFQYLFQDNTSLCIKVGGFICMQYNRGSENVLK